MNRIYKVVWSKVKNMYVVASELAKNRTKSPSSHISGKALVLSILLSLLSMNHAVYAAVTGQETGDKAIAIGEGSVASGDMSSAIGVGAVAEGKNSVVIGSGAKVEGEGAIVLGSGGAVAVSKGAMSWGEGSVAGDQNDPDNNGNNATSFGYATIASGVESTAWGQYTKATNDAATAFGTETLASGTHSTAWGWGSAATGQTATAFGQNSVAAGYRSLAFGNSSIAYGDDSIAALGGITGDGNIDRDNDGNIVATGNGYGEKSVAIGDGARAWTDYVYAVGSGAEVQSDGAIALGNNAKVLNNEDDFTITSDGAIAIGSNTLVNSAENGVAIGNGASVTAAGSVALGSGFVAEEDNVVSVGSADATRKVVNVTAGTNDTDAVNVGQLNESLNRKANIALDNINNDGKTVVRNLAKESVKVVNGTNTTVTEGTDGNAKTYAVNVTTNGTVTENNTGIVTGGTVYNALQAGVASAKLHGIGIKSTTTSDTNYNGEGAVGSSSIAIGRNALAEGKDSVAVGTNANAKGEGSVAFGEGSSKGTNSMAFGRGVASGIRATAWGGPLTSNGVTKYTTASGSDATAFGVGTTASGINSTSWGGGTVASDTQSTAWGTATKASGYGATSFGNSTTAENNNATAFGTQTHAKGRQSTAFGQFTEASNYAATAFGYGIDENAMIRADGFGATAFGVATTRDTVARGTGATAFGYETHATAQMATAFGQRTQAIGAQATAFGAGSIASGRNSTAFGTQSIAGGLDSTAYGTKSVAFGDNSVAMLGGKVGNGTVTTNETTHTSTVTVTKNAKGALAAGEGAVAGNNYAYAVGHNAIASEENSVALGNGAVSSNSSALALGNDSVATGENVISVGHKATDKDYSDTEFGTELKRRIINVAEGTDDTDAVNVSQLNTALEDKANVGLDNITDAGKTVIHNATNVVSGDDIITVTSAMAEGVKTYTVTANINANGQVASGDTGLVSGNTVYNEVRPDDGNYIAKANTTAQNLTALDTKVKTNTDDISDLKDLSNITDAGKAVVKDLAKGSVNVTGSGKATVTKSDVNGVDTYNVEIKTDGAVASGDSNIVTGGTVHDALQAQKNEIDTALGEKANVGLDNITDNGKTIVRTLAQEAVKVVDGTKTTVTEGTDGNAKIYAVNVTVDGTVSNGNDGIVSGGTVYNAIQNVVSEIESKTSTALANKANISLDNVNEAGHNVIKADAKSAINVAEGDHVTVAKTDVNGVDTYTVSVKTDGQVAQNNRNVVSGGTVHEALQAERETTNTSLAGKANVSLDNVTDAGHTVIKEDAKSAINVKGGTYATVDKTNVNGVDTYTVNVANDGSVAEGNDKLVTGGTVYEALNTVISDTNTALEGKANTGLDNITNNGKTVVRDLAKEAVKVVNGTHTTVTEGTEGNVKTYAVNVTTDGRVAQNNEGVVSGGTVYKALQAERDTTDTALETKANVALDNVTDAGHTVIKTDAKAAINVTGGTYATVDKTDVNGVDTYTVHVATDGSVVAGNEKLVTGGTVYDALIAETRPATDGNYIAVGSSAGQNLTALDTQVKTNVDAIDAHTEDITKLKDMSNITDAGKDVIKANAKEAITVTGSGKATVTKTDVSGVDTYNVEVLANGTVTDGNENIVSGGTVYTAIQDAISASEEGTATALAGKANVSLDNITEDGKNVITGLTDVHGGNRYISVTSQKDASGKVTYSVSSVVDGAVEKDNDGLVTGGDVFKAVDDTKKEIENNVDNKLDGKADTDLGNITNDGKEVIHTIAKDAVVVADGDHTKAVKSQDDAGNTVYKVNVVADGVVRTDNTAPVSGATVYNEVRVGQNGTYVLADNTAGANITALDTALKNTVDTIGSLSGRAVVYDSDTKDIVTLTGNGGTKLTNLKDAALTDTSTDAVTGRQLKATNDIVVSHGEEIENLKDLSTITNAGKNVVKNLAKESVGVEAGDRVTVTSSEVNGKAVYKVSANNNGVVEKDNTDLVSGGTVYDALRSNKEETETALGQKANVGLDNITEGGKAVIQNLTNVVSEGNDVKVSSAVVDGVKTYKVGVLTDGQVVHGDSGIVTGGTVYDALKAQKDEMSGALEGKANTNMDNLTDTGKKAVKDLAKEAVTVSAGDHVSVTPIQSDGNVDYKVSVVADGAVAKDDTGIITGGTVYNALKAQSDASEAALGRKADRDLGNITNEGREVIREAVADDLARKANADASNVSQHADDWGRAIATGAVEYDNVRAVSGDTVKKALDGITIEVDGKANTSLDNITPEGEQKIKEVMSEDMAGKANTNLDNLTKAGEQKVRDIMAPDLDKKADKDASNINIGVWSEKLAVGEVAEGNRGLVNGGTVYNALKGMDVVVANPKNSMIQIGGSPKYNDYAVVDVSRSDGRGRIMTGVITNPNDAYSAANVGYVNAVGQNVMGAVQNGFNRVNKKIDKVGANAAAMASLTPMPFEDDTRWSMAAALGTYHGEQAGALGVFYKPSDNVMLNLRGSFGSNENMGGVGVTIGLDKGNTPGVTKAQLVRLVNAQAEELKALKAEHQADKAEIAELKAMVEKLVAKQ